MKKIILILSFLSISCEDKINSYDFYLDSKKYISIKPEKLIYNVGETIEISYKIPNKIGEFADNSTKNLIKENFKINNEDFYLNNHVGKITAKLKYVYTGTVKVVEGDIKGSRITYNFEPKLDMYIAKVKLTFIKPREFYWGYYGHNEDTDILPYLVSNEDEFEEDYYDIHYKPDKYIFGFKVIEK